MGAFVLLTGIDMAPAVVLVGVFIAIEALGGNTPLVSEADVVGRAPLGIVGKPSMEDIAPVVNKPPVVGKPPVTRLPIDYICTYVCTYV
jgi:hypothetical protein